MGIKKNNGEPEIESYYHQIMKKRCQNMMYFNIFFSAKLKSKHPKEGTL